MKANQTLDLKRAANSDQGNNPNIVKRAWFNFCKNNWDSDKKEEHRPVSIAPVKELYKQDK